MQLDLREQRDLALVRRELPERPEQEGRPERQAPLGQGLPELPESLERRARLALRELEQQERRALVVQWVQPALLGRQERPALERLVRRDRPLRCRPTRPRLTRPRMFSSRRLFRRRRL